jgi:hypothetical protein
MVVGKAVALHRTRGRRRKEDMVIERAERRV